MATKSDHTERLNNLTHDVQATVTYLRRVSSSMDSLKSGKLPFSSKTQNMPYLQGGQ